MKIRLVIFCFTFCTPAVAAYVSLTSLETESLIPLSASFCAIEPSEKIKLCGLWITVIEEYLPRIMDPTHSICLSHSSNSISPIHKESCEFQESKYTPTHTPLGLPK